MTNTATQNVSKNLNGVDRDTLFATINAVRDQPTLADFQFRASNEWVSGTHSRTRIESFSGAGGEHAHVEVYECDADHPQVLVGGDKAPTPVEYLLHALASCLTGGIGNIAEARKVKLSRVKSTLEGDMNLQGILGLSDKVRNGYREIRVKFEIEGDADRETLNQIVEQARNRSAVFDVITNSTPVFIEVR